MLSRCFFDFSVSVGAFVIGLSQISSFYSFNKFKHLVNQNWISFRSLFGKKIYVFIFMQFCRIGLTYFCQFTALYRSVLI